MSKGEMLPLLPIWQPKMVERSRCTGHCCEAFVILTHSPGDMLQRRRVQDGPFVADMLISPRWIAEGEVTPDGRAAPVGAWWWSCRHWDRTTRDCTVYERRPAMCRSHGVGYECRHPKCTKRDELVNITPKQAEDILDHSITETA